MPRLVANRRATNVRKLGEKAEANEQTAMLKAQSAKGQTLPNVSERYP